MQPGPGALAPSKHWTIVAGVSIFPFYTIESPITRAFSSGFSVGASLSGENLFDGNGRAVFSVAQW